MNIKLWSLKVRKLDVCGRPLFANLVTYFDGDHQVKGAISNRLMKNKPLTYVNGEYELKGPLVPQKSKKQGINSTSEY